MPWAPARHCAEPGCPNILSGKAPRCPEHARLEPRHPETSRRYGRDWRALSKRFLRDHPTCARCGGVAREVHHVIPLRAPFYGPRLDPENLVALCKRCHSVITGHERGSVNHL